MRKPLGNKLDELIVKFGQECAGATDCGQQNIGAVHGCRCGFCVAFRRFKARKRVAENR